MFFWTILGQIELKQGQLTLFEDPIGSNVPLLLLMVFRVVGMGVLHGTPITLSLTTEPSSLASFRAAWALVRVIFEL